MGVIIDKNVFVAMADGVELSTDVYRPSESGRFPTLVQRLPYNKELPNLVNGWFDVLRAAASGFAVVVQDCRGRYGSGGEFAPFRDEGRDGADTVSWAASQNWSNGQVGFVGGSYMGAAQWLAAMEAPPALLAIAPAVTTHQYYDSWTYQGGALELGFALHWTLSTLALEGSVRLPVTEQDRADAAARLISAIEHTDQLVRRTPLSCVPELDDVAPYYREWLRHPSFDAYWAATAPSERYDRVVIPALNIGGWYDTFLKGTITNYLGMKQWGGSAAARGGQRLVIGPWAHGAQTGWFPEKFFGVRAGSESSDLTGLQLEWFRAQFRLPGMPGPAWNKPVRIFVMGINEWRDEDDWPLPDTVFTDFYLHSSGHANTSAGDGTLSCLPSQTESPDVFVYDPHDPVPTLGGATFLPGQSVAANSGPRDQRVNERRPDNLCYTSAVFEAPCEVTGPVTLLLYCSSSCTDTDFTAKLVDVHPDGRAENLCEGILRTRYRDSMSHPKPMEAGRVYPLRIDLVGTSNVFGRGHCIRLEVSSSNFPRFARNSNTGNAVADEPESEFIPATNRVFHDQRYPSRLVLPVVRRI